tara:strand:+ start:2546 stop:3328 length:783 start_codon:yes stop_codon:yes gene_type:complete
MKILIIIDETSFYHPKFTDDLINSLKRKKYDVYGAIVTKIEKKNNIERYLISKFYKLYFSEILALSSKKILFKILNFLFPSGLKNDFFSVRSAFKKNKISFFNIKENINQKKYFEKIKNIKPDIIISSNSLIFNRDILDIPRLGCINRHTSLLPSYGGLWPVIQAIANNEKKTGVSIHKMTSKIDVGDIYAQREIDISNNKNVSSIYKAAFSISGNLIIEAIENLINNKTLPISPRSKSYYSFPTKIDWINFRKNGGRFV